MIEAEIKGKIPEVQNMEDVLTSNVFGLLKYITQKDVLLEILSQARTLEGKSFLDSIAYDLKDYSPEYLFWEQIGTYGEPDLILKFWRDGEPDLFLCIEVKYYSSKSGEGDDDQLRRYFEGMAEFVNFSKSSFLGIIYLTKYPSRKEIAESLDHIRLKGNLDALDKVFELKWTEVTEAVRNYESSKLGTGEILILNDILNYLEHKNLIGFSKFSFQSEPFNKGQDHFYEATNFRGFTYLKTKFDIIFSEKVFYG